MVLLAHRNRRGVSKHMGRPRRVSDKQLIKDAELYLQECRDNGEIPQVIRFAQRNHMTKQNLYHRADLNTDLFDSIKAITDEKQLVLEENALMGKYNATMAIFSLKQLGWRDKVEVQADVDSTVMAGVVEIPSVLDE